MIFQKGRIPEPDSVYAPNNENLYVDYEWISCREDFHGYWDIQKIIYYKSNNRIKTAKFIHALERKLEVKNKSKFYKVKGGILGIEVSDFWMELKYGAIKRMPMNIRIDSSKATDSATVSGGLETSPILIRNKVIPRLIAIRKIAKEIKIQATRLPVILINLRA